MKKRNKALLIALVLGDGYIKLDHRKSNATPSLKLCHCIKQVDYIKYKANLLHELLGGKLPTINEYLHRWPDGSTYRQVRCEKAHRYFRVLRKWMYPDKYNKNVIKHLTPEAIAIWYMDDGSLIANNRYPDGTCSSARTNLHTCCSTKEKAQELCDYFSTTWDIKFTTFLENGSYSIRCFHQEGVKFHDLIRPYMIPSMYYKQRFYYDTSVQPQVVLGDDIV